MLHNNIFAQQRPYTICVISWEIYPNFSLFALYYTQLYVIFLISFCTSYHSINFLNILIFNIFIPWRFYPPEGRFWPGL